MHIKTTKLTLVWMAIIKRIKDYGTQRFLKKVEIELPYDPAIPLLTLCPKDLKSVPQRYTCIHMLTIALFTIAETCYCCC